MKKYHERIVDNPTISVIKYPLLSTQNIFSSDSNIEKPCLIKDVMIKGCSDNREWKTMGVKENAEKELG